MTKTGRSLGEYLDMGAAGWVCLAHYVKHMQPDTALMQAMGGLEATEWSSTFKTNAMLADVFDKVSELSYLFATVHSKTKPRQPKPYPRPWLKGETKKYGKDPIPITEFWEWWKNG